MKRLGDALSTVLADAAIVRQFNTLGSVVRTMPGRDFKDYLTAEYDKWVPVIRKANIKVSN